MRPSEMLVNAFTSHMLETPINDTLGGLRM